jgi:2,3,4,5-tetrahydropyridine-2,6-dicarboxylate N-succinyltransferase
VGRGDVPERCLVVQATRPRRFPGGTFGLPCALIIKRLGEGRRDDLALEDALREHGVSVG